MQRRLFPLNLLLLAAVSKPVDCEASCYNVDGTNGSGSTPCSSTGNSQCCQVDGGICLSNGYCLHYSQPMGLYRGFCTDETWNSSACPQECRQYTSTTVMLSIWQPNSTTTMYCCGNVDSGATSETDACLDGKPPFVLPDATPMMGFAGLANDEAIPPSTSISSTASPSLSTSASATARTTSNAPTATPAVAVTDPASCHRQDVETLTIGVAIIASLGAVAVSLLVWGLWERKKRLRSPQLEGTGSDSLALTQGDGKAKVSLLGVDQSYNRPLPTYGNRSKVAGGLQPEKMRHPLGELPDAVPAAAEMADFRSTQAVEYYQVDI